MAPHASSPNALRLLLVVASISLTLGGGCGGGGEVPRDSAAATTVVSEDLGFTPPEPGTYSLPPIQAAADGAVLDTTGRPLRLHDVLGDDYVLLSFIYTRCSMNRGCPFATRVFQQVRRQAEADPRVRGRLRLVTLSFDPAVDTPERMDFYAADSGVEEPEDAGWRFLTTASADDLAPILDAYGQFLVREVDARGRETGGISHALKVFLVDPERRVRNIYNSDFLHPTLVVNDVKTLLLEQVGA